MYQHDLSDCCVETELQSKVTRMETKSLAMRFIQRRDDDGLQYKGRTESFFLEFLKLIRQKTFLDCVKSSQPDSQLR